MACSDQFRRPTSARYSWIVRTAEISTRAGVIHQEVGMRLADKCTLRMDGGARTYTFCTRPYLEVSAWDYEGEARREAKRIRAEGSMARTISVFRPVARLPTGELHSDVRGVDLRFNS